MNFYEMTQEALQSPDMDIKATVCHQLLAYCNTNETIDQAEHAPVVFGTPSYASICHIVDPRELPSRKNFDTVQGLATLVHAIAHIEFSAVDLALDATYRFADMPMEYKIDWLVVAEDEIRHFRMLCEILDDLDFAYGDLPVHQGLFDASMHTTVDVLDRMAVIPRHYEATGLDVNPQIIKKLHNQRHKPVVQKTIDTLKIIEKEEIDHVRKGDRWFRWLCERRGMDTQETFIQILHKYDLLKAKPHMNIEARKEAGFSCDELLSLGAKKCE